MSDTRPAPSPLRDGHLTCNELFKAYFAHLALIEELHNALLQTTGLFEVLEMINADRHLPGFQMVKKAKQQALARSRAR